MSLVDMYIDNSEPSENVGQIHFSLEYDFQNTTLILRIIQVSAAYILEIPVLRVCMCVCKYVYMHRVNEFFQDSRQDSKNFTF